MKMMSESDKGIKIKDIVKKRDTSTASINFLKSQLENDSKFPIIHIPIWKMAKAALSILEEDSYDGKDEEINYLIELLMKA
ncbi:hypothetical protein HMPREF2811_06790 [Globicatella sp. HMSC072A10]|uniref:hypothetical protein n=1 Tax=Globicatella sp. HMSC072A10 TaxID=1739315 RepID=UPI0008BC5E39|nr:hypothetical protein [Globicatella sp. HMSC072A10]OFK57061.1 hypothetical protein HMPREF2811_06790 [Globicatella sp. HMSC072A10]